MTVLAAGDDLPPPTSAAADKETSAVSVNAVGEAVGTYKFDDTPANLRDVAVFWDARSGNVNPAAYSLGVWQSPVSSGVFDSQSFALGINNQGRIVGRSRSAAGINRAVLRYAYSDPWKDLNDRHFVHVTTGWVLQSATAINNTGYILGNGTLNGSSRGFVLIPRIPGN